MDDTVPDAVPDAVPDPAPDTAHNPHPGSLVAGDLDALLDFEDPTGSERRLREAIDSTSEPDRSRLATRLARALGLSERFRDGHQVLDQITSRDPETRVRLSLERGRLLRSAGEHEEAAQHFRDAAEASKEAGPAGLHMDALHMLALVAGSPQEQIETNRWALTVARGSEDPAGRAWEASLLHNLGCALVEAGLLEEALTTFTEARGVRQARHQRREGQVATWMVTWTLRLLGRGEEALALQRALKAELEADGVVDQYVDEEISLLQPFAAT